MTELKPCPFCGGNASLRSEWMSDGYRYVAAVCTKCGVIMPGNYSEVGDQAIWDWNTRYERTCHMHYKPLYDEEGADGIECDECGWSELYDPGYPHPAHCPGCGAKVVEQ